MSLLASLSSELQDLVARTAPAVAGVEHRGGQGAGLVLAPDGYVLTNAHVVRGAGAVRVTLPSAGALDGRIVGSDERTDLAVVRVGASGLPALPLAEGRRPRVGQIVVAIGNPFHFDRSISLGVVSALDRSLAPRGGAPYEGLIQTDAAINPGNSGGPLVDAEGQVVGVNTAVIPFAQGIGFAVPAHTAAWISSVLIRKGEVRRPLLGIAARGEELDLPASRQAGRERAVRVLEVRPGAPAERAGLRAGDILLGAEGAPTVGVDDLQRVMVLTDASEIRLDVLRDGRRRDVVVRPALEPAAA